MGRGWSAIHTGRLGPTAGPPFLVRPGFVKPLQWVPSSTGSEHFEP
jgi:hypothetical protein